MLDDKVTRSNTLTQNIYKSAIFYTEQKNKTKQKGEVTEIILILI